MACFSQPHWMLHGLCFLGSWQCRNWAFLFFIYFQSLSELEINYYDTGTEVAEVGLVIFGLALLSIIIFLGVDNT